jgi:transposase
MEHYVGLDVSLKLTSICIVDRTGKVEREGVVASDPEAIATFIKLHAPHVVRIGLETGATSTWLWTELNKMVLPVICIDARHAKAALKMQINKSDRNDAVGIARIMQCSWYKEVCVKDLDSHATKALLVSRALLVKIKRDIENQIRGLLKNLGLVIGRAKMNIFAVRAAQLAEGRSELFAAVDPLLKARETIERQILDLDRKVLRLARNNAQVRRFMTAPGIGPVTALCFLATIDDPARFKRSRSVGAYAGLTTRRYASGEIDWTGRISKCGDKMLRSYLYEAANVLLTRVAKWSALRRRAQSRSKPLVQRHSLSAAGGDIDHGIGRLLDRRQELHEQIRVGGGSPVQRITRMKMQDRRAGLSRLDRRLSNFVRCNRKMFAHGRCVYRSRYCATNDDLLHRTNS